MTIKLSNTAGDGSSTIKAPDTVGDKVFTLPDDTGTGIINADLAAEVVTLNATIESLNASISRPNMLLNGGFQVWAKGGSYTGGVGGYVTADMWANHASNKITKWYEDGFTSMQIEQETGPNTLLFARTGMELSLNSSNRNMKGRTYTISAKIYIPNGLAGDAKGFVSVDYADAVQTSVGNDVLIFDDAGDGDTLTPGQFNDVSWTFTVNVDRYSTNNIIRVLIGGYMTTAFQPGESIRIAEVKLEESDVATPFIYPDYNETLRRCQRYYYAFPASAVGGVGWSYTTTQCHVGIQTATAMYRLPELTATALGSNRLYILGGAKVPSAVTMLSMGGEMITLIFTIPATTIYYPVVLRNYGCNFNLDAQL